MNWTASDTARFFVGFFVLSFLLCMGILGGFDGIAVPPIEQPIEPARTEYGKPCTDGYWPCNVGRV